MPKDATLQHLAEKLGLSKTTISVALRGRPGVSETLRAKIIAEAARMGYKPNPIAHELMAMVRSRRQRRSAETIAFINTFREDPTLLARIPTYAKFLVGAAQQAERYGYRVEEFRAHGGGMTPARLDQVLKARGVRGVLVGPRWFDESELMLDWSAYSSVLLGESTHSAGIYRVCNHHPLTMELALTRLAALGYRRIGIELTQTYESVRHFDMLAGVEPAQRVLGDTVKFMVRIQPRHNFPEVATVPAAERTGLYNAIIRERVMPEIQAWTLEQRLDAFVCLGGYSVIDMRAVRTTHRRPLGYARLDVHPDEGCAGVHQHSTEIGAAGVDLLRNLLHSGERGVTSRPRILLVEGEWLDGPSAPPIA
jgi:LacI family transcriptional regulator